MKFMFAGGHSDGLRQRGTFTERIERGFLKRGMSRRLLTYPKKKPLEAVYIPLYREAQ